MATRLYKANTEMAETMEAHDLYLQLRQRCVLATTQKRQIPPDFKQKSGAGSPGVIRLYDEGMSLARDTSVKLYIYHRRKRRK